MADIRKAGAIIIQNRKLLLTRTKGKDIFVCPGGKFESGETAEQCLMRELKEELGVSVPPNDFEKFGTYFAAAAHDPSKQLEMDVFVVKSWEGQLQSGNEIEEIQWINSNIPHGMKIGSIFEYEVIPALKRANLID